jgi:HEPN domain-containing protein
MAPRDFKTDELISYWIKSSDDDFETMLVMYQSKRYSWALFVGHLMIEKLLKAYYVKINNDYPPFIHNLLRLAEKCKLDLDEEKRYFFASVTAFNINARYDDYKMSFQQKCTEAFTSQWIESLKTNRLWIKELLTK